MKAGQLRTPLEVETYQETTDDMGQIVMNWEHHSKVWAKKVALTGQDYWAAQQAQSDVTGELEIRYIPGLMDKLRKDIEKVRFKHNDRILHIKNFFDPDGRRKRIHLMIKENL